MPRTARPLLSLLGATVVALLPGPALAGGRLPERPVLPGWSLAGEDGAGAIWRNPANLALDPDAGLLLLYNQDLDQAQSQDASLAFNGGPLGLGVASRSFGTDGTWWTLSSSLGLLLDEHLALGAGAHWQLPDGAADNRVNWDLGLTWRPTHWLGVAGIVQNLGDLEPTLGLDRRYGPGLVLRPAGDRLLLGVDALWEEAATGTEVVVSGNLRAELTEGLVVRASGDQKGEVGLGLEVYFGEVGAGAFGRAPVDGGGVPVASAYVNTTDRERRLFRGGRRVAAFTLDQGYPYQPAGGFFIGRAGESYVHLLQRLDRAVQDDSIQGVVLELDRASFSLAQIQELRTRVQAARDAGKTVVAYLHHTSTNGAYLLASAADKIYLHPASDLDLRGLAAELTFFKGTLDLLGVEARFARRAEYKSGPEPFTRTGSSGPAREQLDELLDDLSEEWLAAIAAGRGKELEAMRALVDDGPYPGEVAVDLGLVDGLAYPDELEEKLEAAFGEHHDLVEDYGEQDDTWGWAARRQIAVVYVTGTIVGGESSAPGIFGGGYTAGAKTIVRQLEAAAEDDAVKAVVLRVDSPGGSSFASDEIWRAVDRIQKRGKPVIVSMGGTAASGGYYVSAGADVIFAEPTTVTGSIGVYAGPMINAEELLDRVGIDTELYVRGRNAAMFSPSKPMDDHEFAALDRMVGATYAQFKDRVAEGRGFSSEEVERVARGRVWSGKDALEQGLVDELGGFHDAVARARKEAGIPERAEVRLVTYAAWPGPGREVIERGVHMASEVAGLKRPAPPPLPHELQTLIQYSALQDDKVWAMLPWALEVE